MPSVTTATATVTAPTRVAYTDASFRRLDSPEDGRQDTGQARHGGRDASSSPTKRPSRDGTTSMRPGSGLPGTDPRPREAANCHPHNVNDRTRAVIGRIGPGAIDHHRAICGYSGPTTAG